MIWICKYIYIYIHEYYMFMCVYMGQIQYVHVWKPHPAKDEFLLHHEQNCGITRLTITTVINHLHPLGWSSKYPCFKHHVKVKPRCPVIIWASDTKTPRSRGQRSISGSYCHTILIQNSKCPCTFRGHHIIWAHMTPTQTSCTRFSKKKSLKNPTTQF